MRVLIVIIPRNHEIRYIILNISNGHGLIVDKGNAIETQSITQVIKVMNQHEAT